MALAGCCPLKSFTGNSSVNSRGDCPRRLRAVFSSIKEVAVPERDRVVADPERLVRIHKIEHDGTVAIMAGEKQFHSYLARLIDEGSSPGQTHRIMPVCL